MLLVLSNGEIKAKLVTVTCVYVNAITSGTTRAAVLNRKAYSTVDSNAVRKKRM